MTKRPTILEALLTAAEICAASWLYAARWSGTASLLAGVTFGAFIGRLARAG